MLRIIKWLVFLVLLGGISLVAYAYVGPWLGQNFSPPVQEVRTPIVLEVE